MGRFQFSGSPQQFAELEAAVHRAAGPCRCGWGPLRKRLGLLCHACECLASLLASTDTKGHATVAVWIGWKESYANCPWKQSK